MSALLTHNLGYPRIGEQRELKKATEAYWKGKISLEGLLQAGRDLRRYNWQKQRAAGIDWIPSNDFSFYDQMLDMSCLLGNVPERFGWQGQTVDLDTLFLVARGVRVVVEKQPQETASMFASEMTKWFDTNYHYIVPEFHAHTRFRLASRHVFDAFEEALRLGIKTKPVLIGPVTYLTLGKVIDDAQHDFNRFDLLGRLIPVYEAILKQLTLLGAEWVQLDEPIVAFDLTAEQRAALISSYTAFKQAAPSLKLLVASYFGKLRDNRKDFFDLPVAALHVDAVRASAEIEDLIASFPSDKILSLGIVDGRNVWLNDFAHSLYLIEKARSALGDICLMLAPSCSLLHVPVTLRSESQIDPDLKRWLAFADEKLEEVQTLRNLLIGKADAAVLEQNQRALASRAKSPRIHNPSVKQRVAAIKASDCSRASAFSQRQKVQRAKLKLSPFPTTTIGSLPQTGEVRQMRARYRSGESTRADYERFIEQRIEASIRFQENVDIDMLVHGEFERNDMVEYFGEQLDGFAFTQSGWVQSYGSRYVKPPIIYGDVSRPQAMTVRWSAYAQSLTDSPVKGMLTGPVTILQWSFVRDDQPRPVTAQQIALAIRDEVLDLEAAGIAAIQIDEPAFREGLPLRKADWDAYLDWAVKAFRLACSGVKDETQIHTHMCYSEFNDIIEAIAALDADVITIETSRSNMELLKAFVAFSYPNEIGPGVYDIHSPRVPSALEMESLIRKAATLLPPENLWVNPDCGLKTRQWEEVRPALTHMVEAAGRLREG